MACLTSHRQTSLAMKLLIDLQASRHHRSICTAGILFRAQIKNDLVKTKPTPKEIYMKEFPEYFSEGKFIAKVGYVQFIDDALARMKELGLEKDREAYKELLKIFPPGIYHPMSNFFASKWQYFPQQLAVTRVLHQMSMNHVRLDREFERLAVSVFSVNSEVWNKIARTNYWNMKTRNIDNYPIPEELPKEPHKLAKIGLERMLDDELSVITTTNTSNLPDSIDKTWLVFSQSPSQKAIIDKLEDDAVLYIEESGLTWIDRYSLSYFTLKYYVDPEIAKQRARPPKPDFDYNTIKMNFYGKPVREKLNEQEARHYIDGAYILSVGFTGTSSQDSLSSWLKILQKRNPKLNKLNVVFKMEHKAPEIIEYEEGDQKEQSNREASKN